MNPQRYQRVAELFAAAVELPADRRAAFLDEACLGDAELRSSVEAMLANDGVDEGFLPTAAVPLSAIGGSPIDILEEHGEALPESIGAYRIRGVLGQGGMGVVYLAEQDQPQRAVALKVVRPGLMSAAVLKRFQHEAEILGRLQHPGIAQIYEAGTAEIRWQAAGPYDAPTAGGAHLPRRVPFFAMEYVRGEPLLAYANRRALDTRARLTLLAKVCDAVEHAHRQGIVHRDLKPANILVQDERQPAIDPDSRGSSGGGATAQPKVLDFGVARITNADIHMTTLQTHVGQLVGTLPYMSPEQVAGDPNHLDARSDVYALGVVLYQLLAGRLPFDLRNRSIPEALRMIREHEPTRLSSIDTVFRGDIENIVAKALEKDRTRRYASAAELSDDIQRYLQDRPLLARPASRLYQLRKFARRNRGLVGGTVAAFVFLSAGLAATLYWATREAQQRARAEAQTQVARRQTYQASIAAAQAALQNFDDDRAGRNLAAAPAELRGWEWQYLAWLADRSLATVEAGRGNAEYLAISHDGRTLACGGAGGAIQLRSMADGELIATIAAHSARIDGLGFSRDDVLLASTAGGELQVWDVPSRVRMWGLPNTGRVSRECFSADNAYVAVALPRSYRVALFEKGTGREGASTAVIGTGATTALFSPDGAYLACEVDLRTVVLDARNYTVQWQTDGWPGRFSPDSAHLALWRNWTGPVELFDVSTGQLLQSYRGVTGDIATWDLADDGNQLLTQESNGTVVRRDLIDGAASASWFAAQSASSQAFATGADRIVTTTGGGTIQFWHAYTSAAPWEVPAPPGAAFTAAIPPSCAFIVTGGWGDVARHDAETGAEMWSSTVSRGAIRVLAVSPDERWVAATGEDRRLIVLDANTGQRALAIPLGADEAHALAWSADSQNILCESPAGTLAIRSAATGEPQATFAGQVGMVRGIAVSPDGKRLATVAGPRPSAARAPGAPADHGLLQIWDIKERTLLHTLHSAHAPLTCVAFSADGTQIATGCADFTVSLWSADGQRSATLSGPSAPPVNVGFLPAAGQAGQPRVMAATVDGKIHLWDGATGDEVLTLRLSPRPLYAAAFSPERNLLLSSGEAVSVRACETAAPQCGFARRELVRVARKALDRSISDFDLVDDIVERLTADATLADEVRAMAIDFARIRGDHVNWLNAAAWGAVVRPGASPETYRRALRASARACALWPDDHSLLNTLGVAQYRAGEYAASVATLQRCIAQTEAADGRAHAEDVIFLAMAHFRAGDTAQAQAHLVRARTIVQGEAYAENAECTAFLHEAEELIAGEG